MSTPALLHIEGLSVAMPGPRGRVPVVDGVSLDLPEGRSLGVVGESGSGKTTTLRAILGLLPPGGRATAGRVEFDGEDLLRAGERRLRQVRGGQIGVIWQDPQAALDPVMRVGDQIAEAVHAHALSNWSVSRRRAKELMRLVELPDVDRTFRTFPHQLSGGQRQRVVIASAIAGNPRLLLADEPTTALDVTVQDQVLSLIGRLRADLHVALLLVSHDLAVVGEACDDVAVMYAGRVIERGPAASVFSAPRHYYTVGLLAAAPQVDRPGVRPSSIPGTPAVGVVRRGCAFAPRCPAASEDCVAATPQLGGEGAHQVACHHPLRIAAPAVRTRARGND